MPARGEKPAPFSVIAGDGHPTHPPQIEDELTHLWERAGEADANEPLARTVLLTLLAYCEKAATAHSVAQSINAIAADHPSRAIIVSDEARGQSGEISARVSVACQLVARTDRQVCCEQVFVETNGAEMAKIVGMVLPLALPDVPLVLWLPDGMAPEGSIFERLIQSSDRLLLDSRRAQPAKDFFQWMARLHQQEGPAVIDLAWINMAQHRLAVAQQFDEERARAFLPKIDRVVIVGDWCGEDSAQPESLMLAGWIVSRLEWRGLERAPSGGPGMTFATPAGQQVVFARETPECGAVVRQVTMRSGDEAEFITAFDESRSEALLTARMPGTQEKKRSVHLEGQTPQQILCGALEIPHRDPIYSQTVDEITAMVSTS